MNFYRAGQVIRIGPTRCIVTRHGNVVLENYEGEDEEVGYGGWSRERVEEDGDEILAQTWRPYIANNMPHVSAQQVLEIVNREKDYLTDL